MELSRLRPADWLTGACAVALFLLLFAPWYGVSDGTVSGWGGVGLMKVWFLLTIALAIAMWVATARCQAPAVPIALTVLTATAAAIALILVLIRVLSVPGGKAITSREWGVYVGALSVLGLFAGACWAMRDERGPGLKPSPQARTFSVPAAGAGPRPTDS